MLSKDKIDKYLTILSEKILANFGSETRIKIVIVGGAAIALNYHFRDSTMDIDTFFRYGERLDTLIAEIAVDHGLPVDWMNRNVTVTTSYTPAIEKYATLYKVYNSVLEVYTADALTLICMKCVSCRPDSHDITDIAQLLDAETDISFTDIIDRFLSLYGDWDRMCMDAQMYLTKRFNAMPPDMVDMVWEMLPSSLRNSTRSKYEICNEYYKYLI